MEGFKTKPSRFWNAEYCKMCFVHFLVTMAVFIQFPLLSAWAADNGESRQATFLCGALLCVGMFLPGPFSSYLVDAFRRTSVCYVALVGMALAAFGLTVAESLWQLAGLRLVEGACFGILEMALGGTLINDLSYSQRRTQTDYYYLWFGRFGLPLGMIAIWWMPQYFTIVDGWIVSALLPVVAVGLLMSIKVPFRAPNKVPVFSLDRFWQPQAWMLVLNLLPVAVIIGLLTDGAVAPQFMACLATGLLAAYLTHRNFFESADDRADAVAGLLLVTAAMVLLLLKDETRILYVAFFMLGTGIGWTMSRFLLYFLKLSNHCQRGTLQQTYVLTASTGICIGYFVSCIEVDRAVLSLVLSVVTMVFYLTVTHRWFKKQGGRDFKFREV